jgi:hypothetical protein
MARQVANGVAALLAIAGGLGFFVLLVLIGPWIMQWAWHHSVPHIFPKLVANGDLPAEISWVTALAMGVLTGWVRPKFSTTTKAD